MTDRGLAMAGFRLRARFRFAVLAGFNSLERPATHSGVPSFDIFLSDKTALSSDGLRPYPSESSRPSWGFRWTRSSPLILLETPVAELRREPDQSTLPSIRPDTTPCHIVRYALCSALRRMDHSAAFAYPGP